MVKIALTGGAYQAHSVIASAQRCVNLFPEPMPSGNQYIGTTGQGEPSTHAHYLTPGSRLLGTIGTGPIRGVFQCATGHVYVVSGDTLYSVDVSNWTGTALGVLTPGIKTPVSMRDNGIDLVVVDGMIAGWTVNLASGAFAAIDTSDGTFSGADRVDYLDTYFIFNKPNTPQLYCSGSLAVTFDPLDFANKEAHPDLLVVAVVAHRLIYLFGERTSEIWYDAGLAGFSTTDPTVATSFQFAPMQSQVFIDHGCAAKYSPAVYDNKAFWLTKDRQGQGIIMMVEGEAVKRVSTFAIEAEIAEYSRISDAIGFCYQLAGHSFYVLTFPHADKTWSYDITTAIWHQWAWIDTNGAEHRHRANCYWAVNDLGVIGDWQNGNLYALDSRAFTDNGQPIKRVRAFPHILNDGKRVFYRQLIADFETGTAPQAAVAVPPAPPGFHVLPLAAGSVRGGAIAVSADGSTVVGFVNPVPGDNTSGHEAACYWSSPTSAPTVIGPDFSEASGVSGDGSVIVGNTLSQPFVWTASGGYALFAAVNDTVYAISADGTRLVGTTGSPYQACYWNRSGTRTNLGFLPGHDHSSALAVSADGSCIVGYSFGPAGFNATARAFRWTAATGMVNLGVASGAAASSGVGVSDDGSIVAVDQSSVGGPPAKWVSGSLAPLPTLTGAVSATFATGVSGDGSTVIGTSDFVSGGVGANTENLAYWTATGIHVPTPESFDPVGHPSTASLANAKSVSRDGRMIVGTSHGYDYLPWLYLVGTPAVAAVSSVNMISLRWSDDRGHSFGSPVSQSIGNAGEYRTSLQWQRLGVARDRIWEISWSVPYAPPFKGALWI